ncbi:hypothetical protein I350_06108 [Cryptococcus amylolentus CBS 6273]|uniref:Uncharacterized protein n=1 Tax=Cryptococcus amylolentus CBS 6273 TaxID=1296118 RepID=A0A1E3JQW2_9TREE|nr:hypothetical protein I350_06108 [Cryptococcus amylolentus CBS 6273]
MSSGSSAWAEPPSPSPAHAQPKPILPSFAALTLDPSLHSGPVPPSLPTPSPVSPSLAQPQPIPINANPLADHGPLTPAPSPGPRGREDGRMDLESLGLENDFLKNWVDQQGALPPRGNVGGWFTTGCGAGHERSADSTAKGKGKAPVRPSHDTDLLLYQFTRLPPSARFNFLNSLVPELRLDEALLVSRKIAPLLRRDFLKELPIELSLHILSFAISHYWNALLQDDATWRYHFSLHHLPDGPASLAALASYSPFMKRRTAEKEKSRSSSTPKRLTPFGIEKRIANLPVAKPLPIPGNTYQSIVALSYLSKTNWTTGGLLLAKHVSIDDSVVTSLCMDDSFIVVGMANHAIHVFNAESGAWMRALEGHAAGVWAMVLVSANVADNEEEPDERVGTETPPSWYQPQPASGAYRDNGQSRRSSFTGVAAAERIPPLGNPMGGSRPSSVMGYSSLGQFDYPSDPQAGSSSHRRASPPPPPSPGSTRKKRREGGGGSDVTGSIKGWPGLDYNMAVSGGCDRDIKVWNVDTGECIHTMTGHTSTIRCLKVLPSRPIIVSGSRDNTIRVWNLETGEELHTLRGHAGSVRCVEVWDLGEEGGGGRAVSGSYDHTARLWNLETGECLQVFSGHYAEIYSIAYNGFTDTIITGSLDCTVRVWKASTGECLALLQGHTALVGQLQLEGNRLITGGSDGRVIIFDLTSYTCIHRLCAHDNSVTTLQFNHQFILSGGNDGRVKLWDLHSGRFVRELTKPCDAVWRVGFRGDRVVVLCQRDGKTSLEVVSFRVGEGEKAKKKSRPEGSGSRRGGVERMRKLSLPLI